MNLMEQANFNLDRHLLAFLQNNAFYAEISRHVGKRPTLQIPTAAVGYNSTTDELSLSWNPIFFAGGTYVDQRGKKVERESLTNLEIAGVLQHEFDHIIGGHLNERAPQDKKLYKGWNWACDLAINSGIEIAVRANPKLNGERSLPKMALIPGQRPEIDVTDASPEEIVALNELASLIESFPHGKASEWYFSQLQQFGAKSEANGDILGTGDGGEYIVTLDDHDGWDQIPSDKREYVAAKVKAIIEKAVRVADSQQNGWGNIPAELRDQIRKSISNVINWKSVLHQFVGSLISGDRTTSIKRINRKYPNIHPGVKKSHVAKLLVAIDQSGSVDEVQMTTFFAELTSLTKNVTIDILPFDCEANVSEVFQWKKGTKPEIQRTRMGGTNFNAPTNIVNDPKNRGRWDGLLIMTDGECFAPDACRLKRGWVLSKDHKLNFPTNELVITIDNSKQYTGAWR